jgi:nicotinamidase-related amidase
MKKALLIIDLQNDYFPKGNFPLWNTKTTLINIEKAIHSAQSKNIPIIHIQHIANPNIGISPFFNKGTNGAAIHPQILKAAPDAPVVTKEFADAFVNTNLEEILSRLNITELLVCGMMTQNCVTHTAISKSAEKYNVTILPDCCTTVDEMIHKIALHAVSTRLSLVESNVAI